MSDEKIEEAKAALRVRAHAQRAAFAHSLRADAAAAAARHFFDNVVLGPTDIVAAYWPIRDEMDCRAVLTGLMDSFQPVCLPVVMGDDEPLDLRLWEQGAPLYPSGFGTLAPSEIAPKAEPDYVLMPLLGFDRFGTRLGYGGGYYDRTLAALPDARAIGCGYACQELDEVPADAYDARLSAIATEAGIIIVESP